MKHFIGKKLTPYLGKGLSAVVISGSALSVGTPPADACDYCQRVSGSSGWFMICSSTLSGGYWGCQASNHSCTHGGKCS